MSEFNEQDHPRDSEGKFTNRNDRSNVLDNMSATELSKALRRELPQKKMTPEEKIASVHIDFDRDNILPELNEEDLAKIGAEKNKHVLLKKSVIDRNRVEHSDLTDTDFELILANALYVPSEVFPANKEKPYYHFAKIIEINSKGKPYVGLALLDVDDKKENFEIVHAHFARMSSYETMKRKV